MLILAVLKMESPAEAEVSFEHLFRELYPAVLGFFARRGCSREECQDLAQDTFVRACRSFHRFRFEAKPLTWLLTIATNVWRNRHRDAAAGKRAGEEVALSEGNVNPANEDWPQDRTLDGERRRLLREAIRGLPPQMRRCVSLRVYQEWSYAEIGELLGITAATAKSQVSLAQSRLRSSLAEHYPELDADPDERKG